MKHTKYKYHIAKEGFKPICVSKNTLKSLILNKTVSGDDFVYYKQLGKWIKLRHAIGFRTLIKKIEDSNIKITTENIKPNHLNDIIQPNKILYAQTNLDFSIKSEPNNKILSRNLKITFSACLILITCSLAIVICRYPAHRLTTISGTVLFNRSPIKDGVIIFFDYGNPKNQSLCALIENGKYELANKIIKSTNIGYKIWGFTRPSKPVLGEPWSMNTSVIEKTIDDYLGNYLPLKYNINNSESMDILLGKENVVNFETSGPLIKKSNK